MSIILQNQTDYKDDVSQIRFLLSWRLEYKDGTSLSSDKLPKTTPSIKETLISSKEINRLTIVGEIISGVLKLNLARVDYCMVVAFGYIGRYMMSSDSNDTIGIWIELIDGKMIEIYQNGHVREI